MSGIDLDPIWLVKVRYEDDVNAIKKMILAIAEWIDKSDEEMLNRIFSLEGDELRDFARISEERQEAVLRRLTKPMQAEGPESPAPPVSGRVSDAMHQSEFWWPRYKRWTAEMATVYLVALQEAFVADLLGEMYRMRPELLKSEKKLDLTREQAISLVKSPGDLRALIAKQEIDDVLRGNIDEVAKYLEKRLGISLEKGFKDWQTMREISYRRNAIVHTRGRANTTYCSATGFKELGKDLETDIPYVLTAADVISGFINFLSYETGRLHA